MATLFRIIVYVPVADAPSVRSAMAAAGAGQIGNYDSCSFSTQGIGRFRPLAGADPTIGTVGNVEEVEEEKIEAVVEESRMQDVLRAIKNTHPYEEPAIHVLRMEDYKEWL
jgi:hypothetical protein